MTRAQCSCGALTLTLPDAPRLVVACHCLDCQRRTGSPYGVGAFYPAEAVGISGFSKVYSRAGSSGGEVHNHFCPTCGSTVYWTADKLPNMIAVAVGALGDPHAPPPVRSIFERSKHDWVSIGGNIAHFVEGSRAASS
jgi:hypothetical protein